MSTIADAIETNPRFMIDVKTYNELHEESQGQAAIIHDDLGEDAMQADEPPSDSFLLSLPSKIRGFGLHDKKWSRFKVFSGSLTWPLTNQGSKGL